MEKNKLWIVILVGGFALASLLTYMYFILKEDEVKKEVVEIKFEVPESSNKVNKTSKSEYYKRQINSDKVSKGILLNKKKTDEENYIYQVPKNVLHDGYLNELKADKIDVDRNVDNPEKLQDEKQSGYLDNRYSKSNDDESLDRLLNIMEKNTKQLSNSGAETSVTNNSDLNNLRDLEEITSLVKGTKQKKNQENDAIYRRSLIDEDLPKDVFFGISKDKKAFTGSVSDLKITNKELFKAEFYTTQIVDNGGLITINLLEDIIFDDGYLIPKSTILYGIAQFSPTRLFLKISPNILKNKKRLPSQITVLDFDGIEGIFLKQNLLSSIPVETAEELTELVKENYKSTTGLISNSGAIPIDESAIILGSEKILKYLNRSSLKVHGGYKIWLSL